MVFYKAIFAVMMADIPITNFCSSKLSLVTIVDNKKENVISVLLFRCVDEF